MTPKRKKIAHVRLKQYGYVLLLHLYLKKDKQFKIQYQNSNKQIERNKQNGFFK